MIKKLSLLVLSLLLFFPIFCFCLWFYFDIPIFDTPQTAIHIFNDLGKKKMKLNVYFSFAFALIPPLFGFLNLFQKPQKESFGKARFAEKKDLKKMGLNFKRGFVLAKKWGKKIHYNDPLSLLCFAPPSSGKTQAVCVPICSSFPHSMIILDVKGEIWEKTSKIREKELNNKILVFEPYAKDKSKNTLFFNPFAKHILENKSISEVDRLLKTISKTIFKKEEVKDPHWIESAESIFILLAHYEIQKKGETTFYDLTTFLAQDLISLLDDENRNEYYGLVAEGIEIDPLKFFLKKLGEDQSVDDLIRVRANRFERTPSKEFGSIRSSYETAMQDFLNYEIKYATSEMNFDYEDLRNQNITIYVKVLEADRNALSKIIRIMFEVISLNLLIRESKRDDERVVFMLDEFPSFGKFDFLLELPRISRSYNIVLMLFAQSASQIKKTYSEDDLDIINEIVGYKLFFGANTKKTADYISESIGDFTRTKESQSRQDLNFFGSTNISEEGYKLFTSQDLMNLRDNEVIIQVMKYYSTPLIAEANFWFEDKKLAKKINQFTIKENQ